MVPCRVPKRSFQGLCFWGSLPKTGLGLTSAVQDFLCQSLLQLVGRQITTATTESLPASHLLTSQPASYHSSEYLRSARHTALIIRNHIRSSTTRSYSADSLRSAHSSPAANIAHLLTPHLDPLIDQSVDRGPIGCQGSRMTRTSFFVGYCYGFGMCSPAAVSAPGQRCSR